MLRQHRCLLSRQDRCLLLRHDRCLLLRHAGRCPVLILYICLVSTADICPVPTADISISIDHSASAFRINNQHIMEAATAADLTQVSEIAGRYITLGSAARASRPVPGLVLEVQVPPKMSVRAQIIKNDSNRVQNRPFGLKLGPEACQDRSGAFGMGLTHSKGPSPAKKVKKMCPSRPRISRSIHNPW